MNKVYETDKDYLEIFEKLQLEIEKLDISQHPEEEEILLAQFNSLDFMTMGFKKVIPEFIRLTLNRNLPDNNNTTIKEIKFLKNPDPKFITKYGRANLKQQSVLYATLILPTALMEMNPDKGDLVTISKWKLKEEETPLVIYPVFNYFDTIDMQLKNEFSKAIMNYPDDLKDIIIMDNYLVASYFRKNVDKGKEINYTFSAHLADKIFNKMYNGEIEAIIYPSVKDNTESKNIVLKPVAFEKKYKLVEVQENLVIVKERGTILLKQLKVTDQFDEFFIKW